MSVSFHSLDLRGLLTDFWSYGKQWHSDFACCLGRGARLQDLILGLNVKITSAGANFKFVLSAERSKFVLASLTWHELLSPWLEEGQRVHAGLLQKHLGHNQSFATVIWIRYSPFIWLQQFCQ